MQEFTFERDLSNESYEFNNIDGIANNIKYHSIDIFSDFKSDISIIETPFEPVQSFNNSIDNTTSFYKKISGQKFWLAIKATFSEPTNITIEYIYIDDSNNSKTNFFCDLFHKEKSYFYRFERWCWGSNIDKYYQIHLGPLDSSYYHENSDIQWWGKKIVTWGFRNLTGTCYLTYIAYANDNIFNIWINATKNVTFSTTNGTDVFKLERHDFFGNINIGSENITFILNGEKEIEIKNSLFAWFTTGLNLKNGFEILKYRLPTGIYKKKSQVEFLGISRVINESEDFNKALWWGPSGKWIFKVNMLNRGYYPNIHLFGADIRLPE